MRVMSTSQYLQIMPPYLGALFRADERGGDVLPMLIWCCSIFALWIFACALRAMLCFFVLVCWWIYQVPLVREIMAGNKRGKRLLSLDS